MAENEAEDGEEKKSSKKIIMITAIVLLLAGGGAGYYFMAAGESEGAEAETAEEVEEEAVEGEDEELYFDLNQALTVNFPKGSEASLIQLSVSILVKGQTAIEAVEKHEPMIRNNLLMSISAKGAKNLKTREGKEALRSTMLQEVIKVMERTSKKIKVRNVFFTSFVMQ